MRKISGVIKMLEEVKSKIGDLPCYIIDHEGNIMCDVAGIVKLDGQADTPIALLACSDGIKKLVAKTETPTKVMN